MYGYFCASVRVYTRTKCQHACMKACVVHASLHGWTDGYLRACTLICSEPASLALPRASQAWGWCTRVPSSGVFCLGDKQNKRWVAVQRSPKPMPFLPRIVVKPLSFQASLSQQPPCPQGAPSIIIIIINIYYCYCNYYYYYCYYYCYYYYYYYY